MRILLAIVLAAAALWGGWWWWNAAARERAVEAWLAERRAAGWVAEAAAVEVDGFPNRVDLTVTDLALADPRQGWSWEAPFFQVLALTWKPHHFIAVWPDAQELATPAGRVRAESSRMRGSLVFVPGLALALDRSTVEIADLALTGSGWSAGLGSAMVSVRRGEAAAGPLAPYDLSLRAEALVLPEAWAEAVAAAGVLPARVEGAVIDAVLGFDRPWDRHAVEGENPALQTVHLRDLRLDWGRLDLRGQGELVADAAGFATGRIELRVRNWQGMLEVAVAAGLIGRGAAQAAEAGLGLMARLGGSRNAIALPLVFEGGRAFLAAPIGRIGLGEAPRLTRRP